MPARVRALTRWFKKEAAKIYRDRTRLYLLRPDKYDAQLEYFTILGQLVAWNPNAVPLAQPMLVEGRS